MEPVNLTHWTFNGKKTKYLCCWCCSSLQKNNSNRTLNVSMIHISVKLELFRMKVPKEVSVTLWRLLIVVVLFSLSSTEFCCPLLESPAHVSLWLSLSSQMMRLWSPAAMAPTNTLQLQQALTSSSASMTHTDRAEFVPVSSFTHNCWL